MTADASHLLLAASPEGPAIAIAAVVALGIGAQWAAWRMRVPSILLLLLLGFAIGPGAAWLRGERLLDMEELMGPILLPLVGAAVAIILYEGGLTLRFRDLKGVGRTLTMLVSVGAFITGVIGAVAAYALLGLEPLLAVLIGALLTVTGPTVIGPMLAHIRPAGASGPILRWEGIVIDPIGAIAAVLVLEAILTGNPGEALDEVALAILKTIVVGGGLGLIAAILLMEMMARFWIPERLQNPISLMLVVVSFTASNLVQAESGLLAATVMGIVMANQRRADTTHILEFKENLSVLIISLLFIVLASNVRLEQLQMINLWSLAGFVAVLIFVARPLAVAASTLGSGLRWQERAFIALMAPRGIVAAAVASVFALTLQNATGIDGEPLVSGAERLAPITFGVIVGTVLFYGILAPIAARTLGVSDSDPQGALIIGASRFARAVGGLLASRGTRVLLVDTNRGNVSAARMEGLDCVYGNVLDDLVVERLDLRGIGRVLALTPNAEVNTLALQRFERDLGKANTYTMPTRPERPKKAADEKPANAKASPHGRRLFSGDADLMTIEQRLSKGWVLKATSLSDEFTFDDFRTLYGPGAMVMFIVGRDGEVDIISAGKSPSAQPGETVVAMIDPEDLLMPFAPGNEAEEPMA
jgi:NhaP-type Na+/H+ or K+/H+ antiporter